ncbi:hypothetical protein [Actinomadura darangshiensis]|uniref:hypothetical protein n=1 Tax=Actinomadura darangshiensis TaxID=705336 RepID=UPI00312CB90C
MADDALALAAQAPEKRDRLLAAPGGVIVYRTSPPWTGRRSASTSSKPWCAAMADV